MKKTKFAAILSVCMAPAIFWSSESSAIPTWARKYNVSCYMCHSGFPQRNAVGEAFQNNGYRFAGATEEALTKQKNIKIGNDEWSKQSPNAPIQGSFPQFDPLSMTLGGNLVNYTSPQTNRTTNATAGKIFNFAAPNTVSLFYGGSVGDNITYFGQLGGFGATAGTVTSNARLIYKISPGFNFAMGSSFSPAGNGAWNGTGVGGVINVNGLLPAPTNYAELSFVRGETAGYALVAGTSVGGAPGAAGTSTTTTISDMMYVRGKIKLVGAGLLSGANGILGNSYNGLDNQVNLGFGLSSAKNNNILTGNYFGESLVYGGDIQAVHNNAMVGAAISKDSDLGVENYRTEAGYFIYPWLFAKIAYVDMSLYTAAVNGAKAKAADPTTPATAATAATPSYPAYRYRNPQIIPSVTAWIAPNVRLTATYTRYTKEWKESPASVVAPGLPTILANNFSNQNSFALAIQAGF